jgi:hypothetical protein
MKLRAKASFTFFDCAALFPDCNDDDFDADFDDDSFEPSEAAKNSKCRSNFSQMKICEFLFKKELRRLNEQSIQVKPPVRKSASKRKEDARKTYNTFNASVCELLNKVTPAAVETCDDLETEVEAISVAPPAIGLVKTIVAEIDARTAVVGALPKDTLIMNFTDDSQNINTYIELPNLATTGAFTSQQVRFILRAVMSSSDDAPAINVQVAPVHSINTISYDLIKIFFFSFLCIQHNRSTCGS